MKTAQFGRCGDEQPLPAELRWWPTATIKLSPLLFFVLSPQSLFYSFCLFLLLLFLVLLVVDQWGWFRCVEDWSHGDELNGSGVVYFLFLLLQGLMNNE